MQKRLFYKENNRFKSIVLVPEDNLKIYGCNTKGSVKNALTNKFVKILFGEMPTTKITRKIDLDTKTKKHFEIIADDNVISIWFKK